ncbi:hypothetical protein AVEN_54104-1 [Araneus ventricosus]|uniref:Zinc finger BED domain-containing protein 5 n=1 Tax=Araneus ventricosus TaxID=182803 RepID=A0A4Y2BVL2_ARAVE|nr:hypothetical protein AVEN_54104-1 [Araneus ventricosus]
MGKWLKTGTLERSASRNEILTTDLSAMEITVDQQDDNHEVQRPTDCPVQVDESTDDSDLSILLVIARYLNVNELEENLLLCYPLTKRCTGEDIFNAIQGYFCGNEIDWAKCCGVCTHGGKSMSGRYEALRGDKHPPIGALPTTQVHQLTHRVKSPQDGRGKALVWCGAEVWRGDASSGVALVIWPRFKMTSSVPK